MYLINAAVTLSLWAFHMRYSGSLADAGSTGPATQRLDQF
jgi:hypothetical protein